ncbi:MAG: NAD(P)/FAD-dependent oxidoreductase [Acidobacteriota bacterium]
MLRKTVDVLVIGGGPAGSTAATVLADAGLSVLLCERERFPRFHIGESLLPYNVPLFERLGVWEKLLEHGFQRKWGAHFVFETAGSTMQLDFSRSLDRHLPMALQVRRAEFDTILLEHAASRGVEVWQEAPVLAARTDDHGRVIGAEVERDGERLAIHARAVVDASGRDVLVGKQLGLRRRDPALRQAAMFTHVRHATMDLGRDGGDILIAAGTYGWFWMIPLDRETTSVGCVFPGRQWREHEGDVESFFAAQVAASPEVSRRMATAERIAPIRPTADFSYRLQRFGGDGWVAVGDAAAFLDPVFSSGVLIATVTGERAARTVARTLARKATVTTSDLASYERFARLGLDRFRRYILGFYDPAVISLLCERPPALLHAMATSAFGGKVFSRDPRIGLFEKTLFFGATQRQRDAARGKVSLPLPPAHDVSMPRDESIGLSAGA